MMSWFHCFKWANTPVLSTTLILSCFPFLNIFDFKHIVCFYCGLIVCKMEWTALRKVIIFGTFFKTFLVAEPVCAPSPIVDTRDQLLALVHSTVLPATKQANNPWWWDRRALQCKEVTALHPLCYYGKHEICSQQRGRVGASSPQSKEVQWVQLDLLHQIMANPVNSGITH